MRCRLLVLAVCATALLAARMMAQDTGGGMSGGDSSGASGDTGGASGSQSGGSSNSGNSGGTGSTSGGASQGASGGSSLPGGSDQNGGENNTTTPEGGGLFGPGGTGGGATASPSPSPSGNNEIIPGATPTPTPTPNPFNPAAAAAAQAAPVTFNMPATYGGGAPQSFTLGQGRLAKPPITFTVSVTQGYDDNIFSATSHPVATPTPFPAPTPPLQERIIAFRITPPSPPTPIFQTFRPKVSSTSAKAVETLGVVGSPVSTASVAVQVQKGTPRTLLTMDASLGLQDYFNQPGQQIDDTASFDVNIVHRLSPRATISLTAAAVYQKTPNFALVNAPTNNGAGGNYLNGSVKIDLSYAWTRQFSTVTSYSLGANILQTNAPDVYDNTYGTQFRYAVSARNTITAELREGSAIYPTSPASDTNSTYFLLGLDSFLSARLRNTVSFGLESTSYSTGNQSQLLPYFESATTYALPRGSSLSWTNFYGSQDSGAVNQSTTAYRTTLAFSQPLSTKLVASASIAYNYVQNTDSANSAGSSTQKQFQMSLSLGYTVTPRLSLSLSYTYLDLLTTQIDSSYQRQQIYLGGTYTFK